MSKLTSRPTPGDSNEAEGVPESVDYPDKRPASRTGVEPAVRLIDRHHAPSAETGLTPMVVGEGQDDTDTQDASRTTAETQTSPTGQEAMYTIKVPSVLIIEDSTELAEIIEATLQRLDMVTVHETHGHRAFSRYQEIHPDVVLLDIGLPDMTGWKLLENMKERAGHSPMPKVIIITAFGDPANRLIGKLQNVHEYLIKPFTAEEVERVVLSALGGARQ
ncbi:MAG: response regulator [Anaerolineae bacterium]|nr:response regulator [Anaerolineae bacterium]